MKGFIQSLPPTMQEEEVFAITQQYPSRQYHIYLTPSEKTGFKKKFLTTDTEVESYAPRPFFPLWLIAASN